MFFTIGTQAIVSNIYKIASKSLSSAAIKSPRVLRSQYLLALEQFHGQSLYSQGESISYVSESSQVLKLSAIFDVGDSLATCLENSHRNIKAALDSIRLANEELHSIATLAIDSFFCTSNEPTGSLTTNGAIGIVWFNPGSDWSQMDFVEAILHELTHTLLFVDNLCHGHYSRAELLAEERYFIKSAIRKSHRSFDLSFHSILVACEVLQLRKNLGTEAEDFKLHPGTDELLTSTRNAIQEILKSEALNVIGTDRTRYLLEKARLTIAI